MPFYDYYCPSNELTVEVRHSIAMKIKTWGELCRLADIPIGMVDREASVLRIISAPALSCSTGVSVLKNLGFTKLVRKDKGVYENVTAVGSESKIVYADNSASYPHFCNKHKD